jgi:geranylgeranyl transferase type-1 subunit beta
VNDTVRWLLSRQQRYTEEELETQEPQKQHINLAGVYEQEPLVPGLSVEDAPFVGFNGRCNKVVDTCYAFWVTASLDVWSCLTF